VFNQDTFAEMPEGADFNVIVTFNRLYLPLVVRGT
jgi:hypothetical protein